MAHLKEDPTAVQTGAGSTSPDVVTASAPDAPARRIGGGLLDPAMLWQSLPSAPAKLAAPGITHPSPFAWTIPVWLWLPVVFANLAEAVAEGRGKAQAETLRRTKRETVARRLTGWKPGADPASLREAE